MLARAYSCACVSVLLCCYSHDYHNKQVQIHSVGPKEGIVTWSVLCGAKAIGRDGEKGPWIAFHRQPLVPLSPIEEGMPISSGGKGHVGVGVNTSIKWLPEGGKKLYVPLTFKVNSYLQRYLDCHPEAKKRFLAEQPGEFHSTGRKPQTVQRKLYCPKEKCIVDGKPMQKGQQERAEPSNANSIRLNDEKTANRDARRKAAPSKSSLCTLL